jgi:mannose-6-phosphate isomerase-like protein (cupin superfamily)
MPVIPAPAAPTHDLPGTRFTTLASPSRGAAETSVWRLELLPGADARVHSVTREEIFVALDGAATATLDGVAHDVRAGDTLVLPPGTGFSIAAAGDVPFRAIVCLPVGGQAAFAGGAPFTPPWAE